MSESLRGKIERHAAGAENLAASMAKDGVGLADRSGHVAILKRMASDLRAQAARGITPSGFESMYAAAATLPAMTASARHTLEKSGLAFLLAAGSTDTIALADLDASLKEVGASVTDRMTVKELLAASHRITP